MFSRRRRGAVVAAASIGLATAFATVALGASPVKGAKYGGEGAGSLGTDVTISFKVSASGKRVSDFEMPLGFARGVGDEPCITIPFVKSGDSAAISKGGTFKVALTMYAKQGHPNQEHVGTMVVTGKFAAHGKESGKMEEQFNGQFSEYPESCDATVEYYAKG